MTVKITRDDMSAGDLRKRAGRVKDGRVSQRLFAIALVLEGVSRKVAAESCGMDRQTLRDWVHRYNTEGVEGLANRGGGGVKPLLSADQMAQLASWVEAGPDPVRDGVVRWRRADLARRLEKIFGVKLHQRTVGTYLAKLGFRRLSVRPEHPKADPAAQDAFKKKLCMHRSGQPARTGKGKTTGDLVPRRSARGPARHADPHLGPTRHTPARTARHALQMELYLWCSLPRARHRCWAGPAVCQCRGDGIASR